MRCFARKNVRRIDVMSRCCTRWLALTLLSLSVAACRLRDSGRVDSLALRQDAAGPRLRVAIIGRTNDPRISAAREAVDYWNAEFLRLGRRFRLDAPVVRTDSIPDALLRAASGEAVLGRRTILFHNPQYANLEFAGVVTLVVELTPRFPACLLYTSPSPRDRTRSRMPSSA